MFSALGKLIITLFKWICIAAFSLAVVACIFSGDSENKEDSAKPVMAAPAAAALPMAPALSEPAAPVAKQPELEPAPAAATSDAKRMLNKKDAEALYIKLQRITDSGTSFFSYPIQKRLKFIRDMKPLLSEVEKTNLPDTCRSAVIYGEKYLQDMNHIVGVFDGHFKPWDKPVFLTGKLIDARNFEQHLIYCQLEIEKKFR